MSTSLFCSGYCRFVFVSWVVFCRPINVLVSRRGSVKVYFIYFCLCVVVRLVPQSTAAFVLVPWVFCFAAFFYIICWSPSLDSQTRWRQGELTSKHELDTNSNDNKNKGFHIRTAGGEEGGGGGFYYHRTTKNVPH